MQISINHVSQSGALIKSRQPLFTNFSKVFVCFLRSIVVKQKLIKKSFDTNWKKFLFYNWNFSFFILVDWSPSVYRQIVESWSNPLSINWKLSGRKSLGKNFLFSFFFLGNFLCRNSWRTHPPLDNYVDKKLPHPPSDPLPNEKRTFTWALK